MFSERGFIRPDIEMLGRLIQERDSIVVGKRVGKRGSRRPTRLNGEGAGVPEDAVADRSMRFPAFCNALGERRSQRGRNCYYSIIYVCTRVHML